MFNSKVFIIILNWNQWDITLQCISSIFKSTYSNFQIVLVDNCSETEPPQEMVSLFDKIKFIKNPSNYGFGKGNNPGIKYALEHGAEYTWLLNNDTEVKENTLSKLVSFMEANPKVGVTGSVTYNLPDKATLQIYGGSRLNILRCYVIPCKYGETPDYISGASMFIRAQALKDAGLFDEKFFMYWEDVDLNLRIKEKGWKVLPSKN